MHPKDVTAREDLISISIFVSATQLNNFYRFFLLKKDNRFTWAYALHLQGQNIIEIIIKLKATNRASFFSFIESLCHKHGFRLHRKSS